MAGVLAETEMPPFSIMGLLLGGSSYAGGWFQQRDQLRLAQAADAKERSDREAFSKSFLATPEHQAAVKNPGDVGAQWNQWGQLYGGPESASQLGNNLLTQSLGAIDQRQLAEYQAAERERIERLSHDFTLKEYDAAHKLRLVEQSVSTADQMTLEKYRAAERERLDRLGHDFDMQEQIHGADQQIRVKQYEVDQENQKAQQQIDYFTKKRPELGDMTESQKVQADNLAADLSGYKRREGYDIVRDATGAVAGQIPSKGTPERTKLEEEANAMSNISSVAAESLFELDNAATITKAKWNERIGILKNEMRKWTKAGAMQEGDAAYYESLLPSYQTAEWMPDQWSGAREQLQYLKYKMDQQLEQFGRSTLLPLDEIKADDDDWRERQGYRPTKPPPERLPQLESPALKKSDAPGRGANSGPGGFTHEELFAPQPIRRTRQH